MTHLDNRCPEYRQLRRSTTNDKHPATVLAIISPMRATLQHRTDGAIEYARLPPNPVLTSNLVPVVACHAEQLHRFSELRRCKIPHVAQQCPWHYDRPRGICLDFRCRIVLALISRISSGAWPASTACHVHGWSVRKCYSKVDPEEPHPAVL